MLKSPVHVGLVVVGALLAFLTFLPSLDGFVCVNTTTLPLEFARSAPATQYAPSWSPELPERIPGVARDVDQSVAMVRLCREDSSVGLQLVARARVVPGLLLALQFLVLAVPLVAGWRRERAFTAPIARRARVLGWYLAVGAPVVATVQAVAHAATVDALVPGTFSLATLLAGWDVSVPVLIAGVALIRLPPGPRRAPDGGVSPAAATDRPG